MFWTGIAIGLFARTCLGFVLSAFFWVKIKPPDEGIICYATPCHHDGDITNTVSCLGLTGGTIKNEEFSVSSWKGRLARKQNLN